jgi:hypothetical protein
MSFIRAERSSSSSGQRLEPVLAGRRDEEVSAPDGEGVFGHGLTLQPVLHGFEAVRQVAVEAGEDQPLIVGGALVVVATADQGRWVAAVGSRLADVGIERCDLALRVCAECGLLGAGGSVKPSSVSTAADDALLPMDRVPVPEVGGEADDPYDLVAAPPTAQTGSPWPALIVARSVVSVGVSGLP